MSEISEIIESTIKDWHRQYAKDLVEQLKQEAEEMEKWEPGFARYLWVRFGIKPPELKAKGKAMPSG